MARQRAQKLTLANKSKSTPPGAHRISSVFSAPAVGHQLFPHLQALSCPFRFLSSDHASALFSSRRSLLRRSFSGGLRSHNWVSLRRVQTSTARGAKEKIVCFAARHDLRSIRWFNSLPTSPQRLSPMKNEANTFMMVFQGQRWKIFDKGGATAGRQNKVGLGSAKPVGRKACAD